MEREGALRLIGCSGETDMSGICGGKCGTRMKQKILIIEDDDTIQTQLKTLLSGNGYEADAVTDFSGVIEQFKAFAPHLVLLDIKLPGNSGFEICSQIRSFSDIPIVFVTSSNTDMDELYSIMLGGDALSQSRITQRYCLRKSLPCCGGRMRPGDPKRSHGTARIYIWKAV